jgi:RNA polymerase sigma-70 factor (ECF subfamily)
MSAGPPKAADIPEPERTAAPSGRTDGAHRESTAVAQFARHRNLLFTVAYEITASVADAEDVVQETYLRWAQAAEQPGGIRQPRAYLVQIATRQALNRLRSRARQREEYVGPWLPEPLLTAPDVADDVVLAESVSMAMMLVVESLSPDERAVFVLHEVFGFAHDEIADAIGKSTPAVRQIAHRARSHVQARKPRFARDDAAAALAVQRFLAAAATGDLKALMDVLAPDVVMLSDGGGKVTVNLRPVSTADKVARFLLGIVAKYSDLALTAEAAVINGQPGARIYLDGALDSVLTVEVEGDRVSRVYYVRNPDKLTFAGSAHSVRR